MIKEFLINNVPSLGLYKRYFRALYANWSKIKKTYSQHQEDLFFLKELSEKGFNGENSKYIDIGSNHPSDISNTYLLYRHGFKGILIEANCELSRLCEKFRPNDIVLNIGASKCSTVMDFYISKTPVLSTFKQNDEYHNRRLYKKTRVPVMRVDEAVANYLDVAISLLSIDVESLNLEVLEGCRGILNKTYLLCIEYDDIKEKNEYYNILKAYSFIEIDDNNCNVFYKNTKFQFNNR